MEQIINKEEIMHIIEKALKAFFDSNYNENELIERDISEWAIAFRFGLYLNKVVETDLKGYILDSEFNKYFDKPKQMFVECHESCSECCLANKDNVGKQINGRPDFIIHKRREVGHLCCIEIKKEGRDIQHDKEKLKYMTCPQGKYDYTYGIALKLNIRTAYVCLYSKGKVVAENYLYF